MKRVLSIIVFFLSLQALSAKNLSLTGYLRSGLFADLTDLSAENSSNSFGSVYYDSKHFGGASKSRLDIKYTAENGGIFFRHETSLASSNYFTNSSIQRAMAYASFFDNALIVEGGKLYDRFTAQTGDAKSSFGRCLGVRTVLHPVDSLYFTVQASAKNPSYKDDGSVKADKNLFSLTAKYTHSAFFLTAGAHLSLLYYGCVGLTAIDDLTLIAEVYCDYAEHYKKAKVLASEKTNYTKADLWLAYDFGSLDVGVVGYVWTANDEWFIEEKQFYFASVNPYAKFVLSSLVTLQADGVIYVPRNFGNKYESEEKELYATVTPAVVFTASKKADATLFLKISSDSEQESNTAGLGVRYKY